MSLLEYNLSKIQSLFRGLDRSYGIYILDEKKTVAHGTKNKGKALTKKEKVTPKLWEKHLNGESALGIVPIMDDANCWFGAIDIDLYGDRLDLSKILKIIDKEGLPLIPCRTKSGGLHLYCFVKEIVPAKLMRDKLMIFASIIGFGNHEIFPKQSELLSDRGDSGSWINIPYFGGDKTERFAYDLSGKKLSLIDFFNAAEQKRFNLKELQIFNVHLPSDISDGPPCLQAMVAKGLAWGTQNDGFFNLCIYLKKAFPDDWESHVDEYNEKYVDPPLPSKDIQEIVKSVSKKDYHYACDKSPLKDFCNSSLCRGRKFGVGDMATAPVLTALTKYDAHPPIWFVNLEGGSRLELTTDELQSQQKFQKRCMESANSMPPIVSAGLWRSIINELMKKMTIIEVPKDSSSLGILNEFLIAFCTSRASAQTSDEILLGKAWTNKGKHYFRMSDFMQYLERNRFRDVKVNRVTTFLKKDLLGETKYINIKGKGCRCWVIPEFGKQTEEFDAIEIEDTQAF